MLSWWTEWVGWDGFTIVVGGVRGRGYSGFWRGSLSLAGRSGKQFLAVNVFESLFSL
jgi:hypothetical protein